MTHEIKDILQKALIYQKKGLKLVLASVVYLEGSSYRKPGVRMLITEHGDMVGAVSGGCVEKEVYHQALSVFKDQIPKVMTYDGRYRLGCEGLLYILIEPLIVTESFYKAFKSCLASRKRFHISSYYLSSETSSNQYGSFFEFSGSEQLPLRKNYKKPDDHSLSVFKQALDPCFRLVIFGGEHDAVKLCSMASLLGWEVEVITSIKDPKMLTDFPGAISVSAQTPDLLEVDIDRETAVVLMNHNYVYDLKYLLKLESLEPGYIGILGSKKRREKLINDVYEHHPDFKQSLLNIIHSPAGLDIGSITPEEIALSIVAEILSAHRGLLSASSEQGIRTKSSIS
jgi:xanthine/CO dehydrogenase XdhC/CoxF family maturation factor